MTMPAREPGAMDYLRDPQAIYRQSFETIRREVDLTGLDADQARIAVRVIHACGMTDIIQGLRFGGDAAGAARSAFADGRPILVDATMVEAAIIRRHLPNGVKVICTLNHPETAPRAAREATTRSAAAASLWADRLERAVVVIGNAPTALFRLLEMIDDGAPKPAAIFAFPVGFVGASESKHALATGSHGVAFVTLLGRRGGSAMAGAALNAVLVGANDQ